MRPDSLPPRPALRRRLTFHTLSTRAAATRPLSSTRAWPAGPSSVSCSPPPLPLPLPPLPPPLPAPPPSTTSSAAEACAGRRRPRVSFKLVHRSRLSLRPLQIPRAAAGGARSPSPSRWAPPTRPRRSGAPRSAGRYRYVNLVCWRGLRYQLSLRFRQGAPPSAVKLYFYFLSRACVSDSPSDPHM